MKKDILGKIFIDILNIVKERENKYPITGRPDRNASYKNGWYDASYSIRHAIEKKILEL
jgi:hypothetical protein